MVKDLDTLDKFNELEYGEQSERLWFYLEDRDLMDDFLVWMESKYMEDKE